MDFSIGRIVPPLAEIRESFSGLFQNLFYFYLEEGNSSVLAETEQDLMKGNMAGAGISS